METEEIIEAAEDAQTKEELAEAIEATEANTALEGFKLKDDKGFMRNRVLALIVDLIVVSLLCWLAYLLFNVPDWPGYLQMQESVIGLGADDPLVIERMKFYQQTLITTLAIAASYEALMLIAFRATIGKLLFGMRVVSMKADESRGITSLRYIARAFIKALSIYLMASIPFIFFGLTAFGNQERRSGFDIFAGTRVIDVR
ncbi:MAG: RDD family protein, partial [Coriobacteriia bacterium]|nr:RDD family protein [Coriobacteriia bacterium]